jgi:hypothetical protein
VPIAAFLLMAMVACSGTPASTNNSSGNSSAITPPPETTASIETTVGPTNSEDVAAAFFEAWLADDQDTMIGLAEPEALAAAENLSSFTSENWEFSLCEGAAGTVFCTWTAEEANMKIVVGVRNIEDPHLVTRMMMSGISLG